MTWLALRSGHPARAAGDRVHRLSHQDRHDTVAAGRMLDAAAKAAGTAARFAWSRLAMMARLCPHGLQRVTCPLCSLLAPTRTPVVQPRLQLAVWVLLAAFPLPAGLATP